MSKGYRRRPTVIPLEEADLRWNITFAKTEVLKKLAEEKLAEYYERRKTSYIEKRI